MLSLTPFFVFILSLALSSVLVTDLVLGETPLQLPISFSDDGSVFYISLKVGSPQKSKSFNFFIDTDTIHSSCWIAKFNVHAPAQFSQVRIGSKTIPAVYFLNEKTSLETRIEGVKRRVGILGMNPDAFIERFCGCTLFSNLRRQLGIPRIIGFDLEPRLGSDGQLFVGGYDKSRIQTDTLVYTSVTSQHEWNITFERISFGSQVVKTEEVRITTSTLGINFPMSSKAALQKLFPPADAKVYKPRTDGWYTPCSNTSSLPEFSLQLQTGNFTLGSESFVDHRMPEGYCYVPFRFHEYNRTDLGVVWMRRFYIVFDAENNQVGIANMKPAIDRIGIVTPFKVPLSFRPVKPKLPTGFRKLSRSAVMIGNNSQSKQERFGLVPGQRFETRTMSTVLRALNRHLKIPRIIALSLSSCPQVFVGSAGSPEMEGKLTYASPSSGEPFSFLCTSFGFGEKNFTFRQDIPARLNTASPLILLPGPTRSYVSGLFPRAEESSGDEWWTPCKSRSSLPSFGLTIAGKRLTLGSEYFTDRRSAKGNCRLLLSFQRTISIDLDLGLSWMRHFHIVFDEDVGRVGIANLAPQAEHHLKRSF